MLPFLKNKDRSNGAIIKRYRTPEGSMDAQQPKSSDDDGAEACAKDALDAIKNNDMRALASALRSMFQIFDSQPHEEGPHTEDSADEEA